MKNQRPKAIGLIGGPGAGKGTVCQQLVDLWGFKHLSTGDLCRREIKEGTPLGKEIQHLVATGHMVSSDIIVSLLAAEIGKESLKNHVFVLDGFPRNLVSLESWERIGQAVADLAGVLFLEVPEETLKQRIINRGQSSGRPDDTEAILSTRLQLFGSETLPVVNQLQKEGRILVIQGEGSVDEIFGRVKQALQSLGVI
jgi:adenylate kinase family enzyme